jgi:hypothetical protein
MDDVGVLEQAERGCGGLHSELALEELTAAGARSGGGSVVARLDVRADQALVKQLAVRVERQGRGRSDNTIEPGSPTPRTPPPPPRGSTSNRQKGVSSRPAPTAVADPARASFVRRPSAREGMRPCR